jgi:hypothetical protein
MLAPGRCSLGRLTLMGLACLATAVACGAGAAPEIDGLSDQVAQVGSELTIELNGTDADGDRLEYGFHAADVADIEGRAEITRSPSGAGVFRWTPIAEDVGEHAFDFTVSDGARSSTVTISIEVRGAVGAASAPVFRQPLGSGTTLDLGRQACVELEIVVEDQDSARVSIAQGEPVIAGATLTPRDGLSASWRWCPTREQQAESSYALVLVADDGEARTVKHFVIVLRGSGGPEPACVDDGNEDDDTEDQARDTEYPVFVSRGNAICAGNDDWYHVVLLSGEQMTIDLGFTQSNDGEDLDLHLIRNGEDLWPCSVSNPATCSPAHGQGGVSNEHATFTAPAGPGECDTGCSYYVVVHGFDGSANDYDLRVEIR